MPGYTDRAIMHPGRLDADVVFLQKPFTPAIRMQAADAVGCSMTPVRRYVALNFSCRNDEITPFFY
jgi:hypothetical protein